MEQPFVIVNKLIFARGLIRFCARATAALVLKALAMGSQAR
jgi:hypothetical protein